MSHETPLSKPAPDPVGPLVSLVGAQQLGFEGLRDEGEIEQRTLHMLARALNTHRAVAVIGSGVSKAFGYRGWRGLARALVRQTQKLPGAPLSDAANELFAAFLNGPPGGLSDSERLPIILDLCEEVWDQAPGQSFKGRLARLIKKRSRKLPPEDHDPLRLIMKELEIRRFLTTNYDGEIEDAFERVLGQRGESLTVDASHPEDLIRFAVGAPGYEAGVFHLHGTKDHPETMVVTERDYQRVYLQGDLRRRAYREALSLAFSANPIVFLGVGMREPDLLRPLREFVSDQHTDPRERPLFAILPRPAAERDALELRRTLHRRYGVKVLFYPLRTSGPKVTAPRTRTSSTKEFCDAVRAIAREWRGWWRAWEQKPLVREPVFGIYDGAMVRHYTELEDSFPEPREYPQILKILDSSSEKARAVIVLGKAGTGKGGLGIRLMHHHPTRATYERRFFATMHFTNDFLSIVDAAADFLTAGKALATGEADPTEGALERFDRALRSGRHLVFVGGLERVLTPLLHEGVGSTTHGPGPYPIPVGTPITMEVRRFFEVIGRLPGSDGASDVVLTSALFPAPLDQGGIERVLLAETPPDTVPVAFSNLGVDEDRVKRLLHAVQGHAYALSLAKRTLEQLPEEDRESWLDQLLTNLTAVDPIRAPERTVAAAIERCLEMRGDSQDEARRERKWQRDVLTRVSLFTTPVSADEVCETFGAAEGRDQDGAERALQDLAGLHLLLRINRATTEGYRYTTHTVVRAYFLHKLGNVPDVPGEPQRFDLSGFSSEVAEASPGAVDGHRLATKSTDALLDAIERRLRQRQEQDRKGLARLTRAAFGVVRGRWTATAIGRQAEVAQEGTLGLPRPNYDAYLRRLARLLNAMRTLSRRHWSLRSDLRMRIEASEIDGGTLYVDELAWLYNELGMVAYCQGSLYDAYALFRMGQDVNVVAERHQHGHRWCESEINLGIVQTDRAQLGRARLHLENAYRVAFENDGPRSELEARSRGHLALVHHLGGDYVRAGTLYDGAIEVLAHLGNRRATSIFYRHRADLRRMQHRFEDAWHDIRASVAAAESGSHPDLLHYARIAEANLMLSDAGGTGSSSRRATPLRLLLPAIEFALRVGLPKLEQDAYKVQAAIALHQGDVELAGRLAIKCLSMASMLGMRLRLTAGLVLMGRVLKARGQRTAARELFDSAIRLGQRQGYQLQVELAEREKMQLGEART